MMKKIFLTLFIIFSFIQPVHAEEVTIPTEGFKIEAERKQLENDSLTGAVDIKIYNNSNQTIGVLLRSQQAISWLSEKEIEDEYKIGYISSDYKTVLLYVKPHRFVAKNGFNLVINEDKENINKAASVEYATFTKIEELNNVDINNKEQVDALINKATDKGTFTLNKNSKDSFKSNVKVSETIEEDIKSILHPKKNKTIDTKNNHPFVRVVVILVLVSAVGATASYIILQKKKKEVQS